MLEILESFSDEDFLSNLPEQMESMVKSLQISGASIDDIGINLSLNPSFGLAAKGAQKWNQDLYERIKAEVREIICTDSEKYKGLRESLKVEAKITTNVIISIISGHVGKEIGVSAAVCVPFVVLSIIALLRAATEAILNSGN
jgi:hypothetical protein